MRIVLLGAPGVGKGTYASRLTSRLGVPHISTGDLVRKEVANKSDLGKRIKEYNTKGQLVPDQIIIEMLKERLEERDCENGFLLDGFPRTIPQALELDKITDIDMVLNVNLDEDILIKKLAARRVCRKCGEIYNIADIRKGEMRLPPLLPKVEGKCDKCGGEIYQRDDDKENIVRSRLEVYKKQTQPLIDYYKKKDLLKDVQVVGSPEIMIPKILQILGKK